MEKNLTRMEDKVVLLERKLQRERSRDVSPIPASPSTRPAADEGKKEEESPSPKKV